MPLALQLSLVEGSGGCCHGREGAPVPSPVLMMVFPRQARTPAYFNAAKQTRCYAAEAKASPTEVSSILEQRIRGVQEEAGLAETGRVLSVGYAGRTPTCHRRYRSGQAADIGHLVTVLPVSMA